MSPPGMMLPRRNDAYELARPEVILRQRTKMDLAENRSGAMPTRLTARTISSKLAPGSVVRRYG